MVTSLFIPPLVQSPCRRLIIMFSCVPDVDTMPRHNDSTCHARNCTCPPSWWRWSTTGSLAVNLWWDSAPLARWRSSAVCLRTWMEMRMRSNWVSWTRMVGQPGWKRDVAENSCSWGVIWTRYVMQRRETYMGKECTRTGVPNHWAVQHFVVLFWKTLPSMAHRWQ